MAHLIDKYALVAEIDRQKIGYNIDGKHSVEYDTTRKILNIIDTLEVKEVDLKKEIENYLSSYWPNEKELHPFLGHMAKCFFELGMTTSNKVQKGEEV